MRKAAFIITAIPLAAAAAVALANTVPDPEEMLQNPSSNIAWTEATLALVESGDPERGEELHDGQLCSSCHGDVGIGRSPNWPNLSGQLAGYTYKTLRDYHDWERSIAEGGELMGYIVEELSDQDMADLAAFYRQYSLPAPQDIEITPEQVEMAETLHWLGDSDRLIQPCSGCHGKVGEGVFPDYPSLAGQYADYTSTQLQLYRSGARHSDIYKRMRLLSAELTDAEIEALALYYAQMGDSRETTSVEGG